MNSNRLYQLEELLKEDPQDSFLQYGIALEYAKVGNIPEAIAKIENYFMKTPITSVLIINSDNITKWLEIQ